MSDTPFKPIGDPLTAPADRGAGRRRVAVILLALGAPDRADAARPFLSNLFSDPAVLRWPQPLRSAAAWLLARRRARQGGAALDKLDGSSPLLEAVTAQARALEEALWDLGEVRCVPVMRHWHPMALEAATALLDWGPDEIVLLPLHPQFSTLTTGSALKDWDRAAKAAGLTAPTRAVCCWPTEPGFVQAQVRLTRWALAAAAAHGAPRLLFAAHPLPTRAERQGDPYRDQCERTADAILRGLNMPGLDRVVCHRDGPGLQGWAGPSLAAELARAGRDRAPVVLVPVSAVAHADDPLGPATDAAALAADSGVPHFVEVPVVGADPGFVAGLANLVRDALAGGGRLCGSAGPACPAALPACPQRAA